MAQVSFGNKNFTGIMVLNIETKFDGEHHQDKEFSDFDEFAYYMRMLQEKKYGELVEYEEDVYTIQLIGITFKGKQDSERFVVDMHEGWKRATISFDEKKYGDINKDKLKRIKAILDE